MGNNLEKLISAAIDSAMMAHDDPRTVSVFDTPPATRAEYDAAAEAAGAWVRDVEHPDDGSITLVLGIR